MARRRDTGGAARTARFIARTVTTKPRIALVLGSGLGRFAEQLQISHTFVTSDLPDYPLISVEGHAGKIHFGTVQRGSRRSEPLVVFQGRVHFYETGSLKLTTFPIDLASHLGARTLVVTNAAGGVNRSLKAGDFMLLDDLLSLTFLGVPTNGHQTLPAVRPFRMSRPPFDPDLQRAALRAADEVNLRLHRGVYCWLKGPSYETLAEIEMLSRLGVDAVGMSTVPEVARAIWHGMRVLGISVISNMAAGIEQKKLSHKDVTETGERVRKDFERLLISLLLALR